MTTIQILNFLEKNVETGAMPGKVKFSPIACGVLTKICKSIKSALRKTTNLKVNINAVEFRQSMNFDLIDPNIKKEIENIGHGGFLYTFNVLGRQVNLYMYGGGGGGGSGSGSKLDHETVQKIYTWLYVAFLHAPTACSQQLDIYLYLTDLQKTLPKKGEHIDVLHANTAFTTTCREHTEINLFRREEWFKVLIHETFHCLGLDFADANNELTKGVILELFSVKSDVNLSETYCEVWAELINILFIAFFDDTKENICGGSGSGAGNSGILAKMENILKWEQTFSMFQCCKVLDFYGVKYDELTSGSGKVISRWSEKTNVLSYYIIKCVLLCHVNDFLTWCSNHNGQHVIRFMRQGQEGMDNLVDYCKLVREHYKDDDFVSRINVLCDWFSKTKISRSNYEMATMRMSVF